MISVIIPTYREPEYLDLCLKSCIEGQKHKNQVVVVVDGYFDENKSVLEKYGDKIEILNFEHNVGLPKATNYGVYNAKHGLILIVNDDNVFPKNWDNNLSLPDNSVVAPNQIEPIPSIFKQFKIKDLGRNPNNFDLENFWKVSEEFDNKQYGTEEGGTLPIFIRKKDFLRIGGWDENYPTNGLVADWDFFHKCKLSEIKLLRHYSPHFYHFVSAATTPTQDQIIKRRIIEQQGHEYAKYKWGEYLKHHLLNGT